MRRATTSGCASTGSSDSRRAATSTCAETAGGSAAEIAKAKELLDAGTINQTEFDAIKAKATQ